MMRELHRDNCGAVMVTGVFIGSFLIGATWMIFGVARAAIFRERVQEAADAAAFSSAALHAKGMNLIAAINLVFFAITAIWLALRTFEEVMKLVQDVIGNPTNCGGLIDACHLNSCVIRQAAVSAIPGFGAALGQSVCQGASALWKGREATENARKKIGDVMDRAFPPLSRVQDVTARLAPAAGTVASLALGARFGHFTVAISPSLIPAADLGQNRFPNAEFPLGLPVIKRKFGYLCNRTGLVILNLVKDAVRSIPVIGDIIDFPIISGAVNGIINGASEHLEQEFCGPGDAAGNQPSRKIFGQEGPKGMFSHAENSSDHLQVWAFTRGELEDYDVPRIAIAQRKFGASADRSTHWYYAQAEFYYDCKGAWADAQCNGPTDRINPGVENAVYNMKWRARLRRVRRPNPAAELGRYLKEAVFSDKLGDRLQEALGFGKRGETKGFPQNLRDGVFDQIWGWMDGKVSEAFGIENTASGSTPEGCYH